MENGSQALAVEYPNFLVAADLTGSYFHFVIFQFDFVSTRTGDWGKYAECSNW